MLLGPSSASVFIVYLYFPLPFNIFIESPFFSPSCVLSHFPTTGGNLLSLIHYSNLFTKPFVTLTPIMEFLMPLDIPKEIVHLYIVSSLVLLLPFGFLFPMLFPIARDNVW